MATGIAEHGEARRRERVYLRKAYLQKQEDKGRSDKEVKNMAELAVGHTLDRSVPNTYDQQVRRMENLGMLTEDKTSDAVDRQRRSAHYKQMQSDYSAKIQHRYTSIDYVSQW